MRPTHCGLRARGLILRRSGLHPATRRRAKAFGRHGGRRRCGSIVRHVLGSMLDRRAKGIKPILRVVIIARVNLALRLGIVVDVVDDLAVFVDGGQGIGLFARSAAARCIARSCWISARLMARACTGS